MDKRSVIALKVSVPSYLTPEELTRVKAEIMQIENAGVILEFTEQDEKDQSDGRVSRAVREYTAGND